MIACDARRTARIRLVALVAMAAALYLPSVFTRDLWDPDEPKYAEAAREMISRGDFILPHLNGDVYSEKPPLFLWLTAAASRLPLIRPGSEGRVVSWLAATGTMLLTWRIGAIVMGEATGALAAALMATTVLFWQLCQSGIIDPLLTFLCTAALYGFTRHRCRERVGMPIFYIGCALGVLAKGPVGFLIPALAAMTYSVMTDGAAGLKAAHPLWGVPLVAAPVAAWLAAASARAGVGYAETMLFKQNVGRAWNAFIHKQPLHYFVAALPVSFLPWTLFLPQALVAAAKERVDRVRPMLFPLAWFASTFVLFSIISGKKTRYMLPLFPAASLLVAGWMMRRFFDPEGRLKSGRGVLVAASLAGAILAAALLAPVVAGEGALPHSLTRAFQEPGSEEALDAIRGCLAWPGSLALAIPALVLGGFSFWSLALAIQRRGVSFAALLAGWTIFLVASGALWTPIFNRIKSVVPLAAEIVRIEGSTPLHYLHSIHGGKLNYALGRDHIPLLHGAAQVLEATRGGEILLVGDRGEFSRLEAKVAVPIRYRTCRRTGDTTMCVASVGPGALGG
ncbi:MAG: phospholipid carrier-dependent glycosyltransferase [Acidobacteria bacterium]|nr:phospholipid carrier-dependent glycosyltransferase [Acidobacteriota bacterium]